MPNDSQQTNCEMLSKNTLGCAQLKNEHEHISQVRMEIMIIASLPHSDPQALGSRSRPYW